MLEPNYYLTIWLLLSSLFLKTITQFPAIAIEIHLTSSHYICTPLNLPSVVVFQMVTKS